MFKYKLLLITLCSILLVYNSFGQCKFFAKKECLPALSPFINNEKLNLVLMSPGEIAQMKMVFYAKEKYRLLVCNQEILGKVDFKVLDANNNEIYDSSNSKKQYWDFILNMTQELTVEISAPEEEADNGIVNQGCVFMMVGFSAK